MIKSELRTACPTSDRFRVRGGRPRCLKGAGAGKSLSQALVTSDRHAIQMMEVLADILACVFEEAKGAGKIDLPSGSHVAHFATVQTKEQLQTR
jgi:hypothetical protein